MPCFHFITGYMFSSQKYTNKRLNIQITEVDFSILSAKISLCQIISSLPNTQSQTEMLLKYATVEDAFQGKIKIFHWNTIGAHTAKQNLTPWPDCHPRCGKTIICNTHQRYVTNMSCLHTTVVNIALTKWKSLVLIQHFINQMVPPLFCHDAPPINLTRLATELSLTGQNCHSPDRASEVFSQAGKSASNSCEEEYGGITKLIP